MSNPIETQADLTAELQAYCDEHGLPQFSADELACEISGVLAGEESAFIPAPDSQERRQELGEAHRYLSGFIRRWDEAI